MHTIQKEKIKFELNFPYSSEIYNLIKITKIAYANNNVWI
jgi:hypothetical protein